MGKTHKIMYVQQKSDEIQHKGLNYICSTNDNIVWVKI